MNNIWLIPSIVLASIAVGVLLGFFLRDAFNWLGAYIGRRKHSASALTDYSIEYVMAQRTQ